MAKYIDADKVIAICNELLENDGLQASPSVWQSLHRIKQLPCADVRENRHRRWKTTYLDHEAMGERPKILYCSECNQCIAYSTNYCPNCGADMRGEVNG